MKFQNLQIASRLAAALALLPLGASAQEVPTQMTQISSISSHRPIATISADGRYSVFKAIQHDDSASEGNIYLLDHQTQAIQQIDITPDGAPSSPKSGVPVISGNGRYVVFSSTAPEMGLPASPANGAGYFLRDLQLGTTQKIASASWTLYPRLHKGAYAGISYDGRFVVYRIEGNTAANPSKLYVWDRDTQTATATAAPDANFVGLYERLSISNDGRYIAYMSNTSSGVSNVWVHDRQTGLNEPAAISSTGAAAANNTSRGITMSADGSVVAFQSNARNLGPVLETVTNYDVFVRNRLTGVTDRASLGNAATKNSVQPSISPDGRYVVYHGYASADGLLAMWVYDRLAHAARGGFRLKTSQNYFINYPSVSNDGRYVSMYTHASGITPQYITWLDYGVPSSVVLSTNSVALVEGGLAATYAVSLSREPGAPVQLTIAGDAQQLGLSATQLNFTAANWNVPQVVSLSALQDNVAELPHVSVVHHTAASSDPFYQVAAVTAVQASIRDAVAPTIVAPGTPGRPLQTADATLTGTAAPNTTVLLTLTETGSANLQAVTLTADSEGNWLYTFTGLANGGYTVQAQADGIESATVAFSVYVQAPDQ